jgi:hypothetical protein
MAEEKLDGPEIIGPPAIPPEAFKSRRAHAVVLNDAAWSIIQAQRGLVPIWLFPYRGRQVSTMNNTAWQRAAQRVVHGSGR